MNCLKSVFFDPSRDVAVATTFCWFYRLRSTELDSRLRLWGGVVTEVMNGLKRYLTIVLQHNEVTNIQSVQSLGRKPDSAEDHPVTKHGPSWLYTCKLRFNSDLRKRMSIGATEGHSVIARM